MSGMCSAPEEGVIVKGVGGLYTVRTSRGLQECRARGIFRKNNTPPLVGDRVMTADGVICDILPRKNSLSRPLCANIDRLFIVISLADPEPNTRNIDLLAACAQLRDIEPVLVFNKLDLGDVYGVRRAYGSVPFLQADICVRQPDPGDVQRLIRLIEGRTVALGGASGVGKSSLVNLLRQSDVALTGDISRKLRRGRNTTRHAQLFELCGGRIIDTPGFSSFLPEYFRPEDLQALSGCFPEFAPYEGKCRFADCAHIREPGCAVRQAVDCGAIARGRYEGYVAAHEYISGLKPWKNDETKRKNGI